jgi:phosphopantetheinyl transferase
MPSERPAALALLAHSEVTERAFRDRLSGREAAHLAGLANPLVRRRWLAGRLAAKHLLLGGGDGGRLTFLDGERLRSFPAARYREIELMPLPGGGTPRVSISHSGGFSCAALPANISDTAPTGMDLETVVPRGAAFYRGNFTPRERRWADDGARATGLDPEWLHTFLWTLKEAALKSGATTTRSVWGFAGLEIRLPAELPGQLAASRGAALGERFAGFEALVCEAGRRTRARVETTSTPEAILSLFTAPEAIR